MNAVLSRWNGLSVDNATGEILPCCGSNRWAREMSSARPLGDATALLATSDAIWRGLGAADWNEAFRSHPRIGGSAATEADAQSAKWSAEEQARAAATSSSLQQALADGNRQYENKFHRIFIICASGKSTVEILDALRRRLENDAATELLEAAEQQRQITRIRLNKWLAQ